MERSLVIAAMHGRDRTGTIQRLRDEEVKHRAAAAEHKKAAKVARSALLRHESEARSQLAVMKAKLKELETIELKHGRLAMIGIISFACAVALPGSVPFYPF